MARKNPPTGRAADVALDKAWRSFVAKNEKRIIDYVNLRNGTALLGTMSPPAPFNQGGATSVTPPPIGPVVSALDAGFDPTVDLGTTGNWFVSKTGDNTTGTSPETAFRTIAQALAVMARGDTIRIIGDGAIYRESILLTDKGGTGPSAITKILAYGTDKPIISAAETLTTWTQCSSPTDDAVLGAALAATGKVWKKTGLAKTSFAGGTGGAGGTTLAANLYQNGVKLNIATGKAVRSIYPDVDVYTPNWLVSPLVGTSGANITNYQLPAELFGKGFTSGQFTDVVVLQHIGGNAEYANTVASFASDTVTVTTAQPYDTGSAYANYFALQNFLPEMRKGEWGFRDTGGGNVTLYVWPDDAALGANMVIDYSARGYGVKIGGTGCNASLNSYVEIAGLIFERQSSNGADTDENEAISFGGVPGSGGIITPFHRTNISIHDCMIRNTWRKDRAYGQIWAQYADYVTVQRVTGYKLINSFGVFFQGEPWYGSQAVGLRFMDNVIEEASNSCVRMMAQQNYVVARNRFINSCIGDHSNQLNPYVISKDGLVYGNIFQDCTGYVTWGDSNQPDMLFNYIDSSHTLASATYDARGLVNQNNNDPNGLTQGMTKAAWITLKGGFTNPQAPPCWYETSPFTGLAICNQITPNSLNVSSTAQGMALGISDAAAVAAYTGYFNCKALNNISNGIAFVADTWASLCMSNLTTKGVGSITGLTSVDTSNVFGSNVSEYTDISLNNWLAPANARRRLQNVTTQSIAADIAALAIRFPDVATMLDYDCAGRLYDKTNPPIGPFTNVDDIPSYAPLYWTPPTLGGAASSGSYNDVAIPVSAGNPVSALSYEWFTLTDYRDISTRGSLLGTGNTSPIWTGGDIGAYPACKINDLNSAGSLDAWTVGLSAINSGVLISTPTLLTPVSQRATGSATNANRTIATSTNGLPLVLIISCYAQTLSSYITWTVDVDGTPMTLKSDNTCVQSNTQIAIFLLTGLASGAHTITMSPSANYFSFAAQAIEIGGATNLINGSKTGASTTAITPTVTPAFNDGAVLHVASRSGGDGLVSPPGTYPIVLTNANSVLQINSGGTNQFSDLTLIVGFEQWPFIAPCNATFTSTGTTPPNRQFIGMSFAIDP